MFWCAAIYAFFPTRRKFADSCPTYPIETQWIRASPKAAALVLSSEKRRYRTCLSPYGLSHTFHIFPFLTSNERQVRNRSRDNRWDMPVFSNLSFGLLSWISVFLSKVLFLYCPSILNFPGKTGKQPDLPGDMRLFAIPFLSHISGYGTGNAVQIPESSRKINSSQRKTSPSQTWVLLHYLCPWWGYLYIFSSLNREWIWIAMFALCWIHRIWIGFLMLRLDRHRRGIICRWENRLEFYLCCACKGNVGQCVDRCLFVLFVGMCVSI